MFNLKEIKKAIDQIAEEKGLDSEQILTAIESSIAAAYKKEFGKRSEIIKCKFDLKTGALNFWQIKTVEDDNTVKIIEEIEPTDSDDETKKTKTLSPKEIIDEEEDKIPRYNPDRHILIEEAKKINKKTELGEELEFPLEVHDDFGRIAAQTAKQVVLQKLREAERGSIIKEYQDKVGEIISGVVQRFERGNTFIDLGRAVGIMFSNETIPGEHYKPGNRMRFYLLAVQEESRVPGIILSRSHPDFIKKLFEIEVPEISDETVEIKAIAREPGNRTKIAVASNAEGIDPVGSCVGQRGTRVMAVSNELGQEKIDIIEWADSPEEFITNALSPAKINSIEILDRREAKAFVPEDQLSLAIGKGGQNVRLAAKLTGWKIDVRSQSRPEEVQEGGVSETKKEKEDMNPEGNDE
jgi:transcription termination/antitermination protein NusA